MILKPGKHHRLKQIWEEIPHGALLTAPTQPSEGSFTPSTWRGVVALAAFCRKIFYYLEARSLFCSKLGVRKLSQEGGTV